MFSVGDYILLGPRKQLLLWVRLYAEMHKQLRTSTSNRGQGSSSLYAVQVEDDGNDVIK